MQFTLTPSLISLPGCLHDPTIVTNARSPSCDFADFPAISGLISEITIELCAFDGTGKDEAAVVAVVNETRFHVDVTRAFSSSLTPRTALV
jgi:hypothetical protein